jgi:hypothetical protein
LALSIVDTVFSQVASVPIPFKGGTGFQPNWLQSSFEQRMRIAERIGEHGAREMARANGYDTVYDGFGRMLPQGPDMVYRASDGRLIVYEAKGGSAPLGHGYGYPQGTSEWAVESAKRVLRSSKATLAEKKAALAVLEAATKGKLEVHAVRTGHVLGHPTSVVLEKVAKSTDDAARLARTALDDLARVGSSAIDDVARVAAITDDAAKIARNAKIAQNATRSLVVVGATVDTVNRVGNATETERQYHAGEISERQREVEHAKNAAGMAGGWGGAFFGAKGGAALGAFGGPWGAAGGGAIGGIGGYFGCEAAAEAVAEWGVNRLHDAGSSIKGAWNWAWGINAVPPDSSRLTYRQ